MNTIGSVEGHKINVGSKQSGKSNDGKKEWKTILNNIFNDKS